MISKFISAQLRQPSGAFGRFLMGRLLNRFNARINQLTIALLDLQPSDNVLEIGFGGGEMLGMIAEQIDISRGICYPRRA